MGAEFKSPEVSTKSPGLTSLDATKIGDLRTIIMMNVQTSKDDHGDDIDNVIYGGSKISAVYNYIAKKGEQSEEGYGKISFTDSNGIRKEVRSSRPDGGAGQIDIVSNGNVVKTIYAYGENGEDFLNINGTDYPYGNGDTMYKRQLEEILSILEEADRNKANNSFKIPFMSQNDSERDEADNYIEKALA